MADSTCAVGTPVTPSPVGQAADCTHPNGNGHSEVVADSGSITMSFVDPTAVVNYTGNGDSGLTTGYIQSDTAGRGVIRITTNQAFTYTGTGSTLVGQTGATGADTLLITAPSVTMTTGTLTALGAGSTALDIANDGGASSGGIDVTVDGDIHSAGGPAIILDQNNADATGSIALTSTAGNTITSGAGNAVTVQGLGSGAITIDLADTVSASGGDGIAVRDAATGGDISVTTAAVSALDIGHDAIDIQSLSTTADVTIVANGAVIAGDDGVVAKILGSTATGNINVTTKSTINARSGIDAVNSGAGMVTVNATGVIIATGSDGILGASSGGSISLTAVNVSATAEQGIDAQQTDAAGAGAISIAASGDVSGIDGLRALNSGTGAVTIAATGSVTGSAGDAILIVSTHAAAGAISVTTTAGEVLRAGNGDGIDIITAGTGNVGVNNAASITSDGAGPNTLGDGIGVGSTGTGNITVNNSGAIGTAGDRAQENGMALAIANAASGGTVSVAGSGAIFSVDTGIDVLTHGTGAVSVNYSGAIDTTGGHGIQVDTTSGTITVSNGGTINAPAGNGIDTGSTTGNQTITVGANVNGGAFDGVVGVSTSGTITVDVNGGNVIGADDAVRISSNGAKTVTVAVDRTLSGDFGIFSTGTGATTITNRGTITGAPTAILSTTSATTINNLAGGTINGAISLSDLNDAVTNAGAINLAGLLDLGAGNDLYDGRDGSVVGTIDGDAGNDTILGGAGAETMVGGLGADILEGNGGADNLTGGTGSDIFRGTAAGLNGDTITDFAAADKIVISNASLAGFSFSLSGSTLTYTGGSLTLTGFSGQLQASAAVGGGVQLTVQSAVAGARDDFNGDGRSDILWRHNDGTFGNWLSNANGSAAYNSVAGLTTVPTDWHIAGTGDFNGDGRSDILWRHNDGTFGNWLANAQGGFAYNPAAGLTTVPTDWRIAGTGDFNGDGRDDILWRNDDGTFGNWLSNANGSAAYNSVAGLTTVPTDWHIAGTGDFNGDGRSDILWRHNDGTFGNWLANAQGGFAYNPAAGLTTVPTDWRIVGTGDFNGDGRDDILWRNDDGTFGNWLANAQGAFAYNPAAGLTTVPTDWRIADIGDFNGDGRDDILWRHNDGTFGNWLADANGAFAYNPAAGLTSIPNSWHIQSPDIFWV